MMEIRTEKNELDQKAGEVGGSAERVENDLGELEGKNERAQRTRDAKLNNVKTVRGADFEQ